MNDAAETKTIREHTLWTDGALCAGTVVLDVRTPAEFREAHIPGSVNIPLPDLEQRVGTILERVGTRRIALVCRTGRRAEIAQELLHCKGVSGLHVLEGGVLAWLDSGLPVNEGKKAVSVERQVRITAGLFVLLGVVLGAFVHPGFLVLSGFVGAGLTFSGITDTCPMSIALTRMPWNRGGACWPTE